MEQFYTDERNVQILIALLKEHGIKKLWLLQEVQMLLLSVVFSKILF